MLGNHIYIFIKYYLFSLLSHIKLYLLSKNISESFKSNLHVVVVVVVFLLMKGIFIELIYVFG